MPKIINVPVLFSFFLGVVAATLGILTLRHEIWPLAGHVGIVIIYSILMVPLAIFLFVWYKRVVDSCHIALGEKVGKMIDNVLSFLIVTLITVFALIIGIFFVVVI